MSLGGAECDLCGLRVSHRTAYKSYMYCDSCLALTLKSNKEKRAAFLRTLPKFWLWPGYVVEAGKIIYKIFRSGA